MYSIIKPSDKQICKFIAIQRRRSFSYPEVGATRDTPPSGYTLDHNRVWLGVGRQTFEQAKAAMRRWEMFNLGWISLCWPTAPLEAGTTVAVLARALGVWSLNACRIVYTIAETGQTDRFGFAYGTLPAHAERGEERFCIEWQRRDDSVWYDILAFSQPNQFLTKIAQPYVRRLQKQFARDSMRAMVRAVTGDQGGEVNE